MTSTKDRVTEGTSPLHPLSKRADGVPTSTAPAGLYPSNTMGGTEDKPALRPGDREPTTYHEIAQRPDPIAPAPSPDIPQQPPNSPWAFDPVPNEEPLGYSVED